MTRHVPKGHHSLAPYLVVKDAARALDFYVRAFGAVVLERMTMPDGRIGHAELRIGDSVVMLADEFPEEGCLAPAPGVRGPVSLHLYVEDVDATVSRAASLGARIERPVEDRNYGDRRGDLVDPFGHRWLVATHLADVSIEEIERRTAEATRAPA
jgi:PhnB protein